MGKIYLSEKEYKLMAGLVKKVSISFLRNIMFEKDKIWATNLELAIIKPMDTGIDGGVIPCDYPYVPDRDVTPADKDDFPELPAGGYKTVTTLTKGQVERLAKLTKLASKDSTRPALTGIHIQNYYNTLRAIATDGYILGTECLQPNYFETQDFNFTILPQMFTLANKLKCDWTLEVREHDARLVSSSGLAIVGKLIEAQVPDYEVLYKKFDKAQTSRIKDISKVMPYIKAGNGNWQIAEKSHIEIIGVEPVEFELEMEKYEPSHPLMSHGGSILIMPLATSTLVVDLALVKKVYYKDYSVTIPEIPGAPILVQEVHYD